MAYDVFLVTVPEDFDMAKLVARRLRSLKFTVRFNQKQTEDDIFDAKDARDAGKSGNMLVLWSENSVKNDWVRAAAAVGNSRDGMLVHAGIDKTIPYEPLSQGQALSRWRGLPPARCRKASTSWLRSWRSARAGLTFAPG
jgi:hypothetical protein